MDEKRKKREKKLSERQKDRERCSVIEEGEVKEDATGKSISCDADGGGLNVHIKVHSK